MQTLRRNIKPITHVVLLGFLVLSLHVPTAQAGLVGTDTIINANQAQQARDHLNTMLDRENVQQELLALGANMEQIQARVAALTDEEVQQLATKMDQMPSGSDSTLAIAAIVFIVLLVTDILGFTDIFPFVKKPARH